MTTDDQAVSTLLPGVLYGGDYNPEQWSEEVWQEDVRLMQEAGVNCVSLAIFSWAKLEPQPGQYDFGWLDRIIDLLHANGIQIMLATATASPPPWFSQRYPESLPVDKNGLRFKQGSRQHYCPTSAAYREGSARLAGLMAQRYGQHPAVLMWHVNNEYACHSYECFCDHCRDEFRAWLQTRYASLDALNDAWGTAFWSQRYGQWDEIELPNRTITFVNPGHMLDYRRFMNASILALFRGEIDALRTHGANQPIFTNMVFGMKWLDQFEWATYGDFNAIDIYPDPSLKERAWSSVAFAYDMMRSVRQGKPFLLLEQATTQVNWRPINQLKPPGMMRALSYQAVARGADSVMFFQWRQSKAGAEKYHSAMVPHTHPHESRIFAEVSQLGAELKQLTPLLDSQVPAQVGMLYSYENVWALEIESKPAWIEPNEVMFPWYAALAESNIPVDLVHPSRDLSGYRVLVAPLLYQITAEQAENLRQFVQAGGTLVMSYFSGIADENDHIGLGGYPALLRDVLGLRVEEWQPLLPDEVVRFQDVAGQQANGVHWADLLHTSTAEVIARYQGDFIDQHPAITRNPFGAGAAYYIGTRPEEAYLRALLRNICADKAIVPLVEAAIGVEASLRRDDTNDYLFVINHTPDTQSVTLRDTQGTDMLTGAALEGALSLEPFGVRIIRSAR